MKKTRSITSKLTGTMLPLMSIVVLVIIIISLVNIKNSITTSLYTNLENESNYNVQSIESWQTAILASLSSVKNTLETVPFGSDQNELAFLQTTTSLNSDFPNGVYEGDTTNFYLDGSGWVPDADYVVKDRDWYKEGLNHDTFQFGTPYVDDSTGSFIISATTLLKRSDHQSLVASTDVSLKTITDQVAAIKVMNTKSGYAFLVDTSSNTILAHPNTDLNAKTISASDADSFLAAVAQNDTVQQYTTKEISDQGQKYLVSFAPVSGTSWVLVSCVKESEIFASLHQTELFYAIFAIAMILITGLVVSQIIRKTIAPVKILTNGISKITDGDFTVQVNPNGNDEISAMSYALKDYISKMVVVITDMRDIATTLDKNATISRTSAVTLDETAESQAQSMQDMKSAIEQLSVAVNDLAENATSLAQVVETTTQHGTNANEKIKNTVNITQKGYESMQHVQKTMQEIIRSVNALSDAVGNVGKSTDEINKIVQMINSIASQTNLLALNASIEAARAGDAGRGFAVVATEIGNLANESTNATNQISKIIENVNSGVSDMVSQTDSSVQVIQENSSSVETACDNFKDIYTAITETSNLIDSMLKEIEQVNDVASNMAAISEEQSASAQEITATIETLAENSNQVASGSKDVEGCADAVANSAGDLMEHLENFKV